MSETAADVLPAIYSNVAGEVIGPIVERLFDVGAVMRCQLIIRGNNDVYAVRTASGGRYVARLSHRRVRGPANVAYETALLAFLKAAGAPVAAPVVARDGRLWRLLRAWEGEREFALFEHLPGRPAGADPGDARAQGAALARIHREAGRFDAVPSLYRYDLDAILRQPMRRLVEVPYLRDELRGRIEQVSAAVEARLGPLESLDWRVCHGDPLAVNAHVRALEDGSLAASYFDFENAGPSWVAHDLAIYFERIARRGEVGVFDESQRRQWSAFVEGYECVQPIDARDYAAIAAFAPVRRLWWPADFAGRIHEWGSSNLQPAWIATHLDAAERWLQVDTSSL